MKVLSLTLENYKRFKEQTLDFRDPETGLAKDLIVLVGQNGAGKSSILQAIAFMLGTATGRLKSPAELDWPGFDWSQVSIAWKRHLSIKMDVSFSDDEIKATIDYFERTYLADRSDAIKPGENPVVRLELNPESQQVRADTHAGFYQFRGRDYARIIRKESAESFALFRRVGTLFWYTEQRTTSSLTPAVEATAREKVPSGPSEMDLLRRRLSDYMQFHERIKRGERVLRPGERDLFSDLENAYSTVFPGHRFDGPVPRTEIDEVLSEPWFYLYDGRRVYELGEMSGGERAVFPLIFDFAVWNIHNSVVLIDELELHLHPPLQQGLLKALRGLGENNQFILTTHSDAVATVTPEASLYRLELN
jgi:predicted ATPase